MRKNDVRKWIHAILDLLPLIVIPVFMVYSHRHQINDYTVQVDETKVVNFNQLYNYDFQSTDQVTFTYEDFLTKVELNNESNTELYLFANYVDLKKDHLYYLRYIPDTALSNLPSSLQFFIDSQANQYPYVNVNSNEVTFYAAKNESRRIGLQVSGNLETSFSVYLNFYDLTQMGYTSTTDFNNDYSNNAYAYTLSDKQLLLTGNTITYDNTDIGSQFFYTLYNTVDHYFNFGNVLSFGNIYEWLNINIFNGSAPLSVYVVWNVFLYEFLMDLIFLLYALFMFFIDMCTNLIERFTCSASGGRLR